MVERVRWSIWDLDGCLANDEGRKYLVTGKHRNYQEYHDRCGRDPLREAEAGLLKGWRILHTNHRVAIFTGRPNRVRYLTHGWLAHHALDYFVDALYMREDHDHRPVDLVKRDMYVSLLDGYPGSKVAFAVDDRRKVIHMFSEMGVPTLQSIIIYRGERPDDEADRQI